MAWNSRIIKTIWIRRPITTRSYTRRRWTSRGMAMVKRTVNLIHDLIKTLHKKTLIQTTVESITRAKKVVVAAVLALTTC